MEEVMTHRSLTLLLLIFVVSGLVASAQTAANTGTQRRPLESVLDNVERTLGVSINYEDPRLECSDDIEDVTDRVQSAAQRAAHPQTRTLVPKGGQPLLLNTSLASPSAAPLSDAISLVTQLRMQYESNGYAGRFAIKQVGSALTVEPSAVRGGDCTWKAATPAMETHISFPFQSRKASETLELILSAVSQRLGTKVGLGSLPISDFLSRAVSLGASDEPANVVLVRLFEQLAAGSSTTIIAQSGYSYHVLYDPGVKYYLMHIAPLGP